MHTEPQPRPAIKNPFDGVISTIVNGLNNWPQPGKSISIVIDLRTRDLAAIAN